MRLRTIHIALAMLLVAGCQEGPKANTPTTPKTAAPAPKKAPESAKQETAKGVAPSEALPYEYTYSPVGRRDPFRSIVDDVARANAENTSRPECGQLCKWDLEQLRLVAVISGISNSVAMLESPDGRGHIVRRGTYVGKRSGRVSQIRSDELVVTEIFKDQMGTPHVNPIVIRLPVDKGETELEEENLLRSEVAQ